MNKKIILIILFIYLLGVIAVFSSCTSVKKLRSNVHQETVKTEFVQKEQSKDSTSKTVTKTIDSSGITVTIVYDSTTADTATSFDIITYPPSKDQYTERISIKSSVTPKSITVNQAKKKQAERIDSTVRKSLTVENIKKDSSSVSTVKTVEIEKGWFRWWMALVAFLLLAAIAAFIYRKQIRSFIIKLPLKLFTMKLFIIILSTFFLASCWSNDSRPPRELAQGVYQEEVIQVPDSVMQWSVEQKQYVKVWGFTTKIVPIKEFEVVPNGQQVKKFANESGQAGFNWIGLLIILGVTAAAVFGAGYFSSGTAKGLVRAAAVLVAISVGFFTLKPANIAQNNAKTITEKQLKYYQSIDPELNYFWDSINKAGGIIGK